MMKKPLALAAACLLTATFTSGCADAVDKAKNTANEKVQEVGDKATEAAKAEASKAAEKAVNEATNAAKSKASEATDAAKSKAEEAISQGLKVDPNSMSEAQISTALTAAGISEGEQIAKSIKAAGPFTNKNLRPKLEKIAAEHNIEKGQIDRVMKFLEVK